jgi:phosphoglucosamine mutase
MDRQLFGTDGIRGVAGEFPLDAATAHAVGAALGEWASRAEPGAEVVIGMDPRESGPWLAAQVGGGLARSGVRGRFAGLVTTPGVAWLTRTGPFVAGVMISASHNPYRDNGIKILDHSGFKLPDAVEHRLEERIFALLEASMEAAPAELAVDQGLDRQYLDYLAAAGEVSLDGLSLVVDCANGAASPLAPELFTRLGARVIPMACEPDGRNINLDCGALYVEGLRRRTLAEGAPAGVAFDGDADRAILVSARGRIIDGDAVMFIAGRAMLERGTLAAPGGRPTVVSTVMSNLGLERAFRRLGIDMPRTPVGDRYVLEEMERLGANLGGEQSGHVIFRDDSTTGDGMLTALRVLEIARRAGADLDELARDLELYPQRLVNVPVRNRRPLEDLPRVTAEIRAAERAFGPAGRVLVRFSGTEPLARVMVEGPDLGRVQHFADRIAAAIAAELA